MIKIILFFLTIFVFSGCTTTNYYTSINKVKREVYNRDTVIVKDILKLVRGYYPPAQTKFFIDTKCTPSTKAFTNIFENNFRSIGYAITYDMESSDISPSIPFAWKIDQLSPSLVRATFNIDNANISRIYRFRKGKYKAISPYTVRGLSSTPPYKYSGFINSSNKGLLMKIISSSLNVRKNPSIDSKILKKYKKGIHLRISYKTKNRKTKRSWSKLKNFKGYVATEYIEKVRR